MDIWRHTHQNTIKLGIPAVSHVPRKMSGGPVDDSPHYMLVARLRIASLMLGTLHHWHGRTGKRFPCQVEQQSSVINGWGNEKI